MTAGSFLAIDWGTTNRRAFLLGPDGAILDTYRDDHGVLAVPKGGYETELAMLRARFGAVPIVAAGMIGSTRGWHEVPYLPVPADATAVAAALLHVPGENTAIVPGLCVLQADRADVMRGEEVQVFGAVAAGLAPPDGLLCQPGTHNKWVRMAEGRVIDFVTAMTGELFALLRGHSILSEMMGAPVADGPAFRAGVAAAARDRDLPAALFGVRASVLLGRLPREDAAAYASGLLIGADVAPREVAGQSVYILADAKLGALYAAAVATLGGRSVAVDSQTAFLAGIRRIWELAR